MVIILGLYTIVLSNDKNKLQMKCSKVVYDKNNSVCNSWRIFKPPTSEVSQFFKLMLLFTISGFKILKL